MFYFWYKCLILNITINRFSHLSPVIKLIPVFEIGNRISPAWFIWLKLKIDFRQYLSYGIAWENFVQYVINKCDNTNAKKKKMEVTTSQTLWDFDEICLLERFFNKHTIQQHERFLMWCKLWCDCDVVLDCV